MGGGKFVRTMSEIYTGAVNMAANWRQYSAGRLSKYFQAVGCSIHMKQKMRLEAVVIVRL